MKPSHQPKPAELRATQRNEDVALIKPLLKVEAVLGFQFHFLMYYIFTVQVIFELDFL